MFIPAPRRPLRICLNTWIGYDTLRAAQEFGFLEAEGVRLQLVDQPTTGDSRRAFETGRVDGIGATFIELLHAADAARAGGSRPVAIGILDISDGLDVILARPPISSVEELRGRRVAVQAGTVNLELLVAALTTRKMKPGDVKIVLTPQTYAYDGLVSGTLDAACSFPPESTRILQSGIAREIFNSAEIPGAIVDVLVVSEATLATRRNELEGILRANRRVVELMLAGDPAVCSYIARLEGISTKELAEQLARLKFPSLAEQALLLEPTGAVAQSFQRSHQSLSEADIVPAIPDPTRLLRPEIARSAANRSAR